MGAAVPWEWDDTEVIPPVGFSRGAVAPGWERGVIFWNDAELAGPEAPALPALPRQWFFWRGGLGAGTMGSDGWVRSTDGSVVVMAGL
jgi:hypothetical protein